MEAYRIVEVRGRGPMRPLLEYTLCPLCAEHANGNITTRLSEEPACLECGVLASEYEIVYSRMAPDYPEIFPEIFTEDQLGE